MLIILLDNLPAKVSPYLAKNADSIQIVLLQAGVYAARNLLNAFPCAQIHAIENDWNAAGLDVINEVALINYDTWVGLCSEHHPIVTIQN